jgi:hypothetical protein
MAGGHGSSNPQDDSVVPGLLIALVQVGIMVSSLRSPLGSTNPWFGILVKLLFEMLAPVGHQALAHCENTKVQAAAVAERMELKETETQLFHWTRPAAAAAAE